MYVRSHYSAAGSRNPTVFSLYHKNTPRAKRIVVQLGKSALNPPAQRLLEIQLCKPIAEEKYHPIRGMP
jgi:hypothetical protein